MEFYSLKKVMLIAPYWPSFRDDFTDKLRQSLSEIKIDLILSVGSPSTQKKIKVSSQTVEHIKRCRTVNIKMGKVSVQWQKNLIKTVREEKPDLVIIHPRVALLNYYLVSLYLSFSGTPKLFWDGGFERLDLNSRALKIKKYLKRVQEFRACGYISYGERFSIERQAGTGSRKKCFVAQNTIDVERIARFSQIQPPQPKKLRLIYFGAITKDKNLETIMHVVKKLERRNIPTELFIIGSGKYLESINLTILDLELQGNVETLGEMYREDLWSFINDSNIDLFCLPGIGGLAVNEAMACGLPVISTPGDGTVHDLVVNGENGWLIDYNNNEDSIFDCCICYLNMTTEEKLLLRENSRKRVLRVASLKNMVNGFSKAIQHGLTISDIR